MGYVKFSYKDETGIRELKANFPIYWREFVGDVLDIYKFSMQDIAPERQGNTKRNITVERLSDSLGFVYSEVDWWDPLVGGHAVYGPIFSERQRRWWFWYLNTVLGGVYVNKTEGYKGGDDFPLEAFYNAEADVESRISEFGDLLVS
ncbi:MAG: hypothetical protein AMQ22_00075 [Candidatus Methanofastidiosum methylothiophilum]|uniref:Uncharacterized protein n=1 Tax=Candidatus Methanofastidiosum methylothiophilum TaxID=1705564 RepID=A0A150J9Q9_9EURY|nr:MAG: hypothetical protein AMQ22_00075 [Candidatus Methanofastidiosum methylthiophilus]